MVKIMDPEEQVNKSNSTFAVLRGYIPFLHLRLLRGMRRSYILFFFSLRWVSCTPNSTVGHLSILTLVSLLFFSSFFSRFQALAPFYFLVFTFFSEHSSSWNNVASGSNQNISSIYFTGNNRDRVMFLAILS